jgi:hypothetical protein
MHHNFWPVLGFWCIYDQRLICLFILIILGSFFMILLMETQISRSMMGSILGFALHYSHLPQYYHKSLFKLQVERQYSSYILLQTSVSLLFIPTSHAILHSSQTIHCTPRNIYSLEYIYIYIYIYIYMVSLCIPDICIFSQANHSKNSYSWLKTQAKHPQHFITCSGRFRSFHIVFPSKKTYYR